MSLLSLISGLFGCGGNKKCSAEEIVSLSTSYYGMERDPVYSFALLKGDNGWFFSASCRVGEQKEHYTSFSCFPISTDEAEKLISLVSEEREITRLRRHLDMARLFHIPDAPTRITAVTFSDGNRIEKNTALGEKTMDYLYSLADTHYEAAETRTLTEVFAVRSCMDFSSSHIFTLRREENAWLFSCDAVVGDRAYRTEVEDRRVEEDAVKEILDIVERQQLIGQVVQYVEPEDDGLFILDETTYKISFDFSDGSRIYAPIDPGEELTEAFYRLAEKYE